jgi:phosphate transport system substrate-binding protein
MKTLPLAILPVAFALFCIGCQLPVYNKEESASSTGRAAKPESTPPISLQTDAIAQIMALNTKGLITEEQAIILIRNTLNNTAPVVTPQPSPSPAPDLSVVTVPSSQPSVPVKPLASPTVSGPTLDPRYKPQAILTGRLRSIGSDTMDQIVASWEKVFTQYHVGLRVVHEGKGSSTATPSLIDGQSDFGPMSRPLQDTEIAKFRERFGYEPTQIRVAVDALGLYVHPSNPISQLGLTLAQVDAIFSSTRKRGSTERFSTWGQLGIGGVWASAPINAYGRNKASGTYGFFRDAALAKGEFGEWVVEQIGSGQVVDQITSDKFGIGYSGIGYKTDGVALAPLVNADGGEPMEPNQESALDGTYPLSRSLYMITNRNPASAPTNLQSEFVTFILGPIGQEIVKQQGYYALPPSEVGAELSKLR